MKNLFTLCCWVISASAAAGNAPHFKKVMIVVLENTDYADAVELPFLGSLGKSGAVFTQLLAEAHPSQPNYVALISGSTQGVSNDSVYHLNGAHIGDTLEKAGKTWKVYVEDYPGLCFAGQSSGLYARKHNPFVSFNSVSGNAERCAKIVNALELKADIKKGTVPDFSLYIPNLNNDGHNTRPSFADQWLDRTFSSKLKDPKFYQDLLFVVTYDESENLFGTNRIFTLFSGDSIIPGSVVTDSVNHYSILKSIEDSLGLESLGQEDSRAHPIQGIWK